MALKICLEQKHSPMLFSLITDLEMFQENNVSKLPRQKGNLGVTPYPMNSLCQSLKDLGIFHEHIPKMPQGTVGKVP